ncbi:MAG: response regulator transcription factor [Chloroflexi bacterium]|nr:response regulator transcription factor [Chloroflexota bacterium]
MPSAVLPPARLLVAILSQQDVTASQLLRALDQAPSVAVGGVFPDLWSARRAGPPPQVFLVDLAPETEPQQREIGLQIKQAMPGTGVVLVTARGDPNFLASLPPEATDGWGYLLRTTATESDTLERAIEGAASGLVVLDPQIVAQMRPRRFGRLAMLTEREHEILALLAQGYSNAGIAQRLVLAEKSIENRLVEIYRKLDLEGSHLNPRVHAVLLFLQQCLPHQHSGPASGASPP